MNPSEWDAVRWIIAGGVAAVLGLALGSAVVIALEGARRAS